MLNVNVIRTVARLGRRLAEAGREARAASKSAAGPAGEQVVEVVAGAVGEVVRAAVVGAVAAVVRGAARPTCPTFVPPEDLWGDDEFPPAETETPPTGAGRVPVWAKGNRPANHVAGHMSVQRGGPLIANR